MRRAVIQVFRATRRPTLRKCIRARNAILPTPSYTIGVRWLSSKRERSSPQVLTSAVHMRNFFGSLARRCCCVGSLVLQSRHRTRRDNRRAAIAINGRWYIVSYGICRPNESDEESPCSRTRPDILRHHRRRRAAVQRHRRPGQESARDAEPRASDAKAQEK